MYYIQNTDNLHVSMTITIPESSSEFGKLLRALVECTRQEQGLAIGQNEEKRQLILLDKGEPQLQRIANLLLEKFQLSLTIKQPQVVYRETIQQAADVTGSYVRWTSIERYAICQILFEPGQQGSGNTFISQIKPEYQLTLSEKYIPHIHEAIQSCTCRGPIAAFPITDLKATLYGGYDHEDYSFYPNFVIAGFLAFKLAEQQSEFKLSEPIMRLTVKDNPQNVHMIWDHLYKIAEAASTLPFSTENELSIIELPLEKMMGSSLPSSIINSLHGSFDVNLSYYREVPSARYEDIIEKSGLKGIYYTDIPEWQTKSENEIEESITRFIDNFDSCS